MFTGIIQAVGNLAALTQKNGDVRICIDSAALKLSEVSIGDSIAVSGVCLTVVELSGDSFSADVSGETIACTRFAGFRPGDKVNLEKALTPSTPLGGHLVTGHVDGVGTVTGRRDEGRSVRLSVKAPPALARYIATKGSICIDGVSLTVNTVRGAEFEMNIVPHTLQATTLGELVLGQAVNLEVDLIARYLERLLLGERAATPGATVTREFLEQHGFLGDK